MACTIVDMPGLGGLHNSTFSHCGSLLAASSQQVSWTGDSPVNVTLFDMKTMSVLQRIPLDDCTPGPIRNLVFSSDGKTLVFDVGRTREIMVFQVHDLNIRRRLLGEDTDAGKLTSAVAFDPTSQVVASAGFDSCVRLWTL